MFKGFASEESRSEMNVTFNLVDAELTILLMLYVMKIN